MLRTLFIRMIYMCIMFVAGLILSNIALPERFGTISLLILNASLLSIVTGLGTESIVLHKVTRGKWKVLKTLQFVWYGILLQFLLFLCLEFASLHFWNRTLLSNEKIDYLAIEVIYFIGLILSEKYMILLYSFQRTLLANMAMAIVALLYICALFLLYYVIKIGFLTALYCFAFQSLIQGIALFMLFHYKHRLIDSEKLKSNEFFSAIGLSFIVMMTNIIQLAAYRLDFWILKYFYSNYEVGIYAQANKFANLVWIIPNVISQLLITKFSSIEAGLMPKVFSAAFYINFIGVLVTVVCTNLFYYLYLENAYQAGLPAFYMMLPGYFFWAGVIYIAAYFSWEGKFVYNLIGSSICLIVILIADLILIPIYGIQGAAWSNSIAYTIVFLIYLVLINKSFAISWNEFFLLRKKDLLGIVKLVSA
jgi:O-antigen/teichoic acid export membrane protein